VLHPDEAQSAYIVGSLLIGVISSLAVAIAISDIPTLYLHITRE